MTHLVPSRTPRADGTQTDAAPPPLESCFAAYPASWYFFCRSRALSHKPIARVLFDRRLVAFRTACGRPAVMDAQCSHMGADLGRGCVVNDRLQCSFHGWQYGSDGRCLRIPAQSVIPKFARQTVYPIEERCGNAFVFCGAEPSFPLPSFSPNDNQLLVACAPVGFTVDCPWYMFAANGFDLQHLRPVHGRKLLCEPEIDCPAPFARRIRYQSQVIGGSFVDRLTRLFAGNSVDVSITAWSGSMILIQALFPRVTSYIMFATAPIANDRTQVDTIVFIRRGHLLGRILQPLNLWLRRTFTMAFVREDTTRVCRAVYRPDTLIESDRVMIDYYRWLAALPQTTMLR